MEQETSEVRAAQHSAVQGNRRVNALSIVDCDRLLEMNAGCLELAQIRMAEPQRPVRLHKHGRILRVLCQAQALFAVFESPVMLGPHAINHPQTELRAE